MLEEARYRGFLFIGDPHVTSRRPGRRKDDDFAETVLSKLNQAIKIALDNNLQPIILGDLTDRARDEKIVVSLIRALIDKNVITLLANHDKTEKNLTDNTTLAVLKEARVLSVAETAGRVGGYIFPSKEGDVKIGLYAVPYGKDIPDDIAELGGAGTQERSILMTHTDIEFDDHTYPGALIPHEIKGCELLVNGHMHLTKPKKVKGETTWFNPGNISRMSMDAKDHVPSVWGWTPDGGIERFELEYEKDVFDLTGYHIDAAESVPTLENSVFVEMLRAQDSLEIEKTDDAGVLAEEMERVLLDLKASDEVCNIVRQLRLSALESSENN